MKDEIMRLLTDVMHRQKTRSEATKELLFLFNVSGSAYQDKLLKKADDMKESGKIWHTNKVYTDGIDCALDNMKAHITKIADKHYR